jgi:hypothetical protein
MGAVAAAAAGPIVGWRPNVARAVVIGDTRLPTLVVDQPVAGVAASGGRLFAVGGHEGEPRVWSLGSGAGAWQLEAGGSAFPSGVGLRAVAASTNGVVAAGSTDGGSGPRPALFRSADGRSWDQVEAELGSQPGAFTAVAERDGRLLAAGCRFAEPDVGEPVATIAAMAMAGDPWTMIELAGVRPVQHGAATLLASVPEGLLLSVTDIDGLFLYLAATAHGPWRRIGLPRLDPPASLVAAGAAGTRTVLAGIDALDRGRMWLGGSRGWREVQVPASLPSTARVMSLADGAGPSLVAAGEGGGSSFVEEVTVA